LWPWSSRASAAVAALAPMVWEARCSETPARAMSWYSPVRSSRSASSSTSPLGSSCA
jgi:hypothetical protein